MTDQYQEIRAAVRALCAQFPAEYFRGIDAERGYPEQFVDALTKAGWLAALIPEEYGGGDSASPRPRSSWRRSIAPAATRAPATARCTTWARCCATARQSRSETYLPKIASGELRLQSMAVTEPTTGTDTTKIKTTAVTQGRPLRRQRPEGLDLARAALRPDDPARAHHAARGGRRGSPKACRSSSSICARPIGKGITVRPIPNMVNHETNELFFDNLEIPAENLIGEEGKGFRYILDGLNAERTLIAAECIGDGYWFIDKVTQVRERAHGVRPADRPESGRAVPDRAGVSSKSRPPI